MRICKRILFSPEDYFLKDPELKDKIPSELLSHADQYHEAVRKACILFRKIKTLKEKGGSMETYRYVPLIHGEVARLYLVKAVYKHTMLSLLQATAWRNIRICNLEGRQSPDIVR